MDEEKKDFEVFPESFGKFYSDKDKSAKTYDRKKASLMPPYSYETFTGPKTKSDPMSRIYCFESDLREAARKIDEQAWQSACAWLRFKSIFAYERKTIDGPASYLSRKNNDLKGRVIANGAFNEMVRKCAMFEPAVSISPLAMAVARSYAPLVEEDFWRGYYPRRDGPVPFPFKNVGMAHMALVRDMDERMEMLRWVDERTKYWFYASFADFVLNWIAGYNAKYGEKYKMQQSSSGTMCKVINLGLTKSVYVRAGDGEEDCQDA